MIMQETELKIIDIFRVMNYHIDSGRKHIYYVIELKSVLSISYEFDFHSRIPLKKLVNVAPCISMSI